MPVYGIIDCGSNTVRLCVYRVPGGSDRLERKNVKTLLNHKKILGLAADVKDGALTARGVKRAARTISDHLAVARRFGCKRIDVFATAFLRNCSNAKEAAHRIEAACGAPVTVLSADEEAHLGFVGAHASNPEFTDGLLMDLGGGSCELSLVRAGRDIARTSVPQGSLSLFEGCVRGVLPDARECAAVEETFLHALASCPWSGARAASPQSPARWEGAPPAGPAAGFAPGGARCDAALGGAGRSAPVPPEGENRPFAAPGAKQLLPFPRPRRLFGIGGSVRALAKASAELHGGPKPNELTRADVEEMLRFEQRDPSALARAVLAQTPDRLHTFTPGLVAVRAVMDAAGAPSVCICKWGLREGYLIERMT